jgi:LysR family hydrogen peroxide-inducible transcriptional activator
LQFNTIPSINENCILFPYRLGKLMTPTLRQFQYLTALAKHRHFGRAAASVFVTQSALSQQIKELEITLGGALVERGNKGVTLTAVGRTVVERAQVVLDQVRDIEQIVRFQSDMPTKLNIGLIPTIAPYLLPHVLPILRADNIGLELGIREAQTHVLLEELAQGQLDAVVIALPADLPGLIEVPLMRDNFLLAGAKGPLNALPKAGLKPSQISPEQLLLLDDGHCLADQALAACQIAPSARVDLRASSLTTLCRLASEGFGFTLLPELAAQSELRAAPALHVHRFASDQPHRTIGLVRREISGESTWFQVLKAAFVNAGQDIKSSLENEKGQP